MATDKVDVVVIGLGPGGEDAAARLAKAGLNVVGVEARLVGGECPYYACVPTKMMIRAAAVLAEARRVGQLAGSAEVRPDWTVIANRIRAEATDNWDDTVAVKRLEDAGGHFVRGMASITGPSEVSVATPNGTKIFQASRGIVLNPGTEPVIPPIKGLADSPYWTNRDAVAAEQVPESLIVLGGGPVGCEFAQVFARFGAKVSIVESQPRLLANDEPEASDLLAQVFSTEDISVHTGVRAEQVSYQAGKFSVQLSNSTTLDSQQLLVAVGRRTDLAALGVGTVGIDDQAHTISVDERMRAADQLWAIGDVTGKGAFTHVSMYQARIAVNDILGKPTDTANYRALPHVTFTDPEIGGVGLTEKQARDQGLQVQTGLSQIPSSSRGWIHKAGNEGLIKLVADMERGILVGATSVGPTGGEVLGALAVAIQAEVPTAQLSQMIYAYPTFHRAIEDALRDLNA